MRLSVILGVCVVLCGAMVANAYSIPVHMTGGNITVGCERTVGVQPGWDEVDFYLTGMLGLAAGQNTDGTTAKINIVEGRWTAANTGAFWVNSNLTSRKSKTLGSNNWMTPTFSTINFDSNTSGATIWTNTGGGGGAGTFSGNASNFFSGSWYTSDYAGNLVYGQGQPWAGFVGPDPNYTGAGTNSTYIAALFVTSATPDTGIGFGNIPFGTDGPGSGKMSFSYNGGTVENVAFYTQTPEPGTLVLLAGGLVGLVAYAWRKRK